MTVIFMVLACVACHKPKISPHPDFDTLPSHLIHTNEVTRQSSANEVPLNFHGTFDHVVKNVFRQLVLQHRIEQASKVRM